MRMNVEKTTHAKLKLNDELKKKSKLSSTKKNKNQKNQDQILKLKILRESFENLKRQVRKK
jgi:hypothetical protein